MGNIRTIPIERTNSNPIRINPNQPAITNQPHDNLSRRQIDSMYFTICLATFRRKTTEPRPASAAPGSSAISALALNSAISGSIFP